MSRRYGQPIRALLEGDRLSGFVWRGSTYYVRAVLATWHLRTRWWAGCPVKERTGNESRPEAMETDRYYSRVECFSGLLCDVYYDAACQGWVLDRVHD